MTTTSRIIIALLTCVLFLQCARSESAEPSENAIESCVVLRISHDLLDDLVPKTVHHPFDINTIVDSAKFKGSGVAQGKVDVQVQPIGKGAQFTIKISGETHEQFVGIRDPVKFYTRGSGPFLVTSQFRFDGIQFQKMRTISTSQQCVHTYQLCSKQRGLAGKLVRRIARKK